MAFSTLHGNRNLTGPIPIPTRRKASSPLTTLDRGKLRYPRDARGRPRSAGLTAVSAAVEEGVVFTRLRPSGPITYPDAHAQLIEEEKKRLESKPDRPPKYWKQEAEAEEEEEEEEGTAAGPEDVTVEADRVDSSGSPGHPKDHKEGAKPPSGSRRRDE